MNERRISLLLAFIMVFSLFVFESSTAVSAATKDESVLIDTDTVWRYLDDGSDPAGSGSRTSWTLDSFDDSNWKTSKGKSARFGAIAGKLSDFKDGTKTDVLLNQYKSDGKNVSTYFFRTELNIDKLPTDADTVVCSVSFDDAVIVYLNGTKLASFYEPSGGFATNLSYGGSGLGTPITTTFSFDVSLLKKGKNIVAVELHQANATSSDVYFAMPKMAVGAGGQSAIALNVGKDESERIVTWRFPASEGRIEYALYNGGDFPAEYKTATAGSVGEGDTYIHSATLEGLQPDSTYIYRLVNGSVKSESYTFKTAKEDEFNFIFLSDPQIGASGNAGTDTVNWQNTIRVATQMFPEASLLVSAGDQVDSGGSDAQFLNFLSPEQMTSLTVAPTIGNHETYGTTQIFTKYFNLPNTTVDGTTFGTTSAGCDYWYRYNNALFIHLNDNNLSAAEHKIVIDRAISENPDVVWKIIVMHQSMFSGGGNHVKTPLINTRSQLVPLFIQYDIDVVLSGHDHVYSRSHIMSDGFTINKSTSSSVTDPNGVLYLTAGSSSGSKYYGMLDAAQVPHSATTIKKTTAFTNIHITGDSFELTTYNVNNSKVIDTFKIIKDKQLDSIPNTDKNIAYNEPYEAPKADSSADALLNDGMAVALYEDEKNWYAVSDTLNAYDGVANIDFDLDTLYDISSVRLHILGGSSKSALAETYGTPKEIKLYTSENGSDYKYYKSFTLNDPRGVPTAYWTDIETSGLTARYVRVSIELPRNTRVLLNEVQIFGSLNPNAPDPEPEEKRENVALNKKYESSKIHSSYPDENGKTLTDGKVTGADSSYSDSAWAGFNKRQNEYQTDEYHYITVDMGTGYLYDEFAVHLATRMQKSGIQAPTWMEVYVSDDKEEWELIGTCVPFDDHESLSTVATVKVGSLRKERYVQFRFVSNNSTWMMVSEIEIFGEKETFMLGDVNGDNSISSRDYVLLRRHILNTVTLNEVQLKASDVNRDGKTNSYDYIYIRRHILGTYVIKG